MNKTYTSLLLAGLLLTSAGYAATAYADALTASVNAAVDYLTAPEVVDITGTFLVENGSPVISGTITAPARTTGDWYDDLPSQEITTPITRLTVVRYSENNPDIPEKVVLEYSNVAPGSKYTFKDTDISAGETWSYRATAWLGDLRSSNDWGQGCLTIVAGYRPEAINDMKGAAASITGPVTLTFTASAGLADEADIPFVPTSVWVTRTYSPLDDESGDDDDIDFGPTAVPEVIWSAENPTPGQKYTVVDDNGGKPMLRGTYTYLAYTSWEWGTSSAPYDPVTIGLFEDKPTSPTNCRATLTDQGALISWDAPTLGAGYPPGFLDPATLRYDVYRYENYSETVLVAENITETSCTDSLDDIESLQLMTWRVIAKNDLGSSVYGGTTSPIPVGPAPGMPFTETFSRYSYGYAADNLWSVERITDTDAVWYISDSAYGSSPESSWIQFHPEGYPDSKHGMAYTSFSAYEKPGTIAYVSSRLDFAGYESGKLTFRYFAHPEASGVLGVDLTFFDSREPMTLWEGTTRGDEEGWVEKSVSFNGLQDVDMLQLRLRATQDTPANGWYVPVMVDYINMEGTQSVNVNTLPADAASVEYYSLQGIRLENPAKGQIVIRRMTDTHGNVSTLKVRM
ncbi:MAG: hypothetical protein K2O24_00230 [Muribaculaceae bacterium]|nr:hypothetical protein [Muribaculaceae bacterium]